MTRAVAAALLLLVSGVAHADSITVFVHYLDKPPVVRVYANGGTVILRGEDGKDIILQTVGEKPPPIPQPQIPPGPMKPAMAPATMPKITAEDERRQALRAFLASKAPRK